jgi:hypothetical protein
VEATAVIISHSFVSYAKVTHYERKKFYGRSLGSRWLGVKDRGRKRKTEEERGRKWKKRGRNYSFRKILKQRKSVIQQANVQINQSIL